MKNKCPKCGYEFTAENQVKGGQARWRGLTKAQRAKITRAAARARWAKHRRTSHD